jgi:hypothetical protein
MMSTIYGRKSKRQTAQWFCTGSFVRVEKVSVPINETIAFAFWCLPYNRIAASRKTKQDTFPYRSLCISRVRSMQEGESVLVEKHIFQNYDRQAFSLKISKLFLFQHCQL